MGKSVIADSQKAEKGLLKDVFNQVLLEKCDFMNEEKFELNINKIVKRTEW